MHCVCALVRNPGAGCSAVLGSFSLPADSSPPARSWGESAWVPLGRGLYLTPFAWHWVLSGVDVVWMLSCVLWSLFYEEFSLFYFHRYMWFWEEISAALLMPPSWLCPYKL